MQKTTQQTRSSRIYKTVATVLTEKSKLIYGSKTQWLSETYLTIMQGHFFIHKTFFH